MNKLSNFALLVFSFLVFQNPAFSQSGYEIKIKIDGFEEDEMYLGYYYGDKQYLKDTTQVNDDGWFVFSGDEELPGGIYLTVLPPENKFIQLLINSGEQHFSMETKMGLFSEYMKVTGSPDNALFYKYMNYLAAKRPEADKLKKELDSTDDEAKKKKTEDKIKAMDERVMAYQKNLIQKHSGTLTAAVVKANMPLEYPDFGEGEEGRVKQWRWTQKHYFDNIDFTDTRMLRTPFFFQRIDHYVNKLTVQHPDTINLAIDQILNKLKPAEESFRFYLVHFLNHFAKSKVVGFDAVYVHLALNYYAKGLARWTDEEQLEKIIDNGKKLEPLLIGKTAPNIQMQTSKGEKIWLHDFKSPFTVLFFWDPDCGHCKKSTPHMLEFSKKYKDKGVEVFAVCTMLVKRDGDGNWSMEDVDKCWEYVEENETGIWFHTVDPYHRSKYKSIYDIRSTPQIYILDEKKEILSKKIGAEQLGEVMDHILKMKEEDESKS